MFFDVHYEKDLKLHFHADHVRIKNPDHLRN